MILEEISLNILDIAQNSIRAGATTIEIDIAVSFESGKLTYSVTDDGEGMSDEKLNRVLEFQHSDKQGKSIGQGLRCAAEAARATGGNFSVESHRAGDGANGGTKVTACHMMGTSKSKPLGNMGETMLSLIAGGTNIRFVLCYRSEYGKFVFDSTEYVAAEKEYIAPQMLILIKDYINKAIKSSNGGREVI